MRTKEEIIKWLRDKGCLNMFYCNYYSQHWVYAPVTMKELLARGVSMITDAFSWSESPELNEFWSDLDTEFRDWY